MRRAITIRRRVPVLAGLTALALATVRLHAAEYPAQVTAYTTAPPAMGTYAMSSASADTLRTRGISTTPAVQPTTPSAQPGVTPSLYEHAPGTNAFHLATAWVHAVRAFAAFEGMLSPTMRGVMADRPLVISLNGVVTSTATDSTLAFITENGRCAADDASLVIHELGHTLLYRHGIVPTSQASAYDYPYEHYRNLEPLALHEGTADFVQATYTGQVEMGRYYFGYPRTTVVSDPARYHLGHYGQPVLIRPGLSTGEMQYLNGMIWSGALWDLRHAIGALADTLLVSSLEHWPKVPTFESAADAVRYAAIQRCDAATLSLVLGAFATRGIGTSLPAVTIRDIGIGADIATSGNLVRVTCRAHAAGGLPPYVVHWRTLDPNGLAVAETFDGANLSIALAESSRIVCEATDGRGHVTSDTLVVPAHCSERVTVNGPSLVTVGEPAQFTLAHEPCAVGTVEALPPTWWRVRHDDGTLTDFGSESPTLDFVPTQAGYAIGCVHATCDSLRFLATGGFAAAISAPATYCNEPTIPLLVTVTAGQAPYTYVWGCTPTEGGACWLDDATSQTATLHPGMVAGYDVSVTVTDAANRTAFASFTLTRDPGCGEGGGAAPTSRATRDALFVSAGKPNLRLAAPRRVHVAAYDVLGRRLAELASGTLAEGEHALTLPRGIPRGTLCFVRAFGTDRPLVVKLVAR